MRNESLFLNASPSFRRASAHWVLDVLIALLPACGFGCFMFGFRALLLLGLSVVSCMVTEAILSALVFRRFTLPDGTALVTGLILGMSLPVTVPVWIPCLGGVFAVALVKIPWGGRGRNILNPAITAHVFLQISYPEYINCFVKPGVALPVFRSNVSALFSPSLSTTQLLAEECMPDTSVADLFLGNCVGGIGTISAFFLFIGLAYLLIRGVVRWEIPVGFMTTLVLLCMVSPYAETESSFAWYVLFGSSAVFVAVFPAADPVTTPMSRMGQLFFGLFCGVACYVVQRFTSVDDAAYIVLLLANLLCYPLDYLASGHSGKQTGEAER